MTFKHVKFEDSSTMRSLVKVAEEKGWVKPEPLNKTASLIKKTDLNPTQNLMDNVVKLCRGLREQGFDKYAEELEGKFVAYKRAQTLYETSKETGDDVLREAHPRGSHKMEDVDSDEAVFEDLIDKHMKTMKAVEKDPTGKLTEASEIIKAVKTALAEKKSLAAEDVAPLYEQANTAFQKFRGIYSAIARKLGEDSDHNAMFFGAIQRDLDKKLAYDDPKLETYLSGALDGLKSDKAPGLFSNNVESNLWQNEILPMFEIAYRPAEEFKKLIARIRRSEVETRTSDIRKQYDPDAQQSPEAASAPVTASQKLVKDYQDVAKTIASFIAQVRAKGLPDANELVSWLNDKALSFVMRNLKEYSESTMKDDAGVIKVYTDKLGKVKTQLEALRKQKLA